MFEHLVKLLRSRRVYVLAVGHLAAFLVAYWLAFCLRFDFEIPPHMVEVLLVTLPWVLVAKLAIFYWTGCYHGWWRYVAFSDLFMLLRAALLSTLAIVTLDRFVLAGPLIPRTVFVLDLTMTILILGGLRSSVRVLREWFWPAITRDLLRRNECGRALIAGTDSAGEGLARLIQNRPDLPYRIVGFLDPEAAHRGSRVGGVPVLGTPDDLERVAGTYPVEAVLVVAGSLPGKCVRQLVDACARLGLVVRVLPALDDLLTGRLTGPFVREVDIEDLLHRDPVVLDSAAIASLIEGQTVLVTGAGGSIGCEICRQVLRFRPGTLLLVERAENNLFLIERELRALQPAAQLVACIADVRDRARMRQIFARHTPALVFHAAAYKHVPMMEFNCGEAIKNNVFGTKRLADLAHRSGVARFVLISTDKKDGFTREQRYAEAVLDTFDMLSPAFDRPMTAREVEAIF